MFLAIIYSCSLNVKASDNISRGDIEDTLKLIEENIVVGFSWVDLPMNQILLLKHKESICAIQFNSFERLGDNRAATTFRSSAETFKASYSKYKFNNIHENFDLDDITIHELESKATFGVGRLTFGGGNQKIECGGGDFYWEFPTGVFLTRDSTDLGLYPLLINDFAQLNKLPSTIKWVRYKENRPKKLISMSLPLN